MVLFEVECLMMMFGSGVSTYGTRYGIVVLSRNNEITTTAVPAGTSRVGAKLLLTNPRPIRNVGRLLRGSE